MPLSFFLLIKNNLGLGTISLVAFLHGCCSAILRGSTPCMRTLLLSPNALVDEYFLQPGVTVDSDFDGVLNIG